MRTPILLSCLLSTLLGTNSLAQTPKPADPAQPATQEAPAKPPVRRRPPAAAAPVTVTLTVSDKSGTPIGDAAVSMQGETSREARTTAGGIARFLSVKPGDYRLRFDHEGFVSFERDLTVKAGAPVDLEITLNPVPAPAAAKAPEPQAVANSAPAGEARSVAIVDFIEKNGIRGGEPIRADQLGCTASAKTTLLQIRDAIAEQARADADEVIYVVAGEGSLRMGNRDIPLQASTVAVIPRGTVRGLARKGKNVLYVLSVVSGPACTK
jgi:mannose-6-phosphate isomerase-like protein (cupin superfamily)